MKFKCDCGGHILQITYDKPVKKFPLPSIAVEIFDIYSPKGRKYKHPKSRADVIILDNRYPKEFKKLMDFLKGIVSKEYEIKY